MRYLLNRPQPLTQQVWEAVPRIQRAGAFITVRQCQFIGYDPYRATALMLMELTGLDYEEAKELARSQPGARVSELLAARFNPQEFQDLATSFASIGKAYGEAFGGLIKAFGAFADGFSQTVRQMQESADSTSQDDSVVTA